MNRKSNRKPNPFRLLDHSTDVIAVVDNNFEITYANHACSTWLGVDVDDLIGTKLTYSQPESAVSIDSKTVGLCPLPQLFDESCGSQSNGRIFATRERSRVWKRASFARISTGSKPNKSKTSFILLIVASGEELAQPPEEIDPTADIRTELHNALARLDLFDRAIFGHSSLVGTSDQAKRIRRQVEAATGNASDCLIIGQPGSGREHLARTIFHERKYENASLVPIHCAIADSQLIQNSLKNWVFEQRKNNTQDWILLLDVDRLSAEGQNELLGYTMLPNFKMPIIATAEHDLFELAEKGIFSNSLAMHLSVQTIDSFALTERAVDIPLLAQAFVETMNKDSGKQLSGCSDQVLELLCEHKWPRNVSELKQVIEVAFEKCAGSVIQATDLPDEFHHGLSASRIGYRETQEIDLGNYLADIEKRLIQRAIKQTGNNKTRAAKLLGISRAKLLRRSAALGLVETETETDSDNLVDESAFKEAD